jgi:hypothetical protein
MTEVVIFYFLIHPEVKMTGKMKAFLGAIGAGKIFIGKKQISP